MHMFTQFVLATCAVMSTLSLVFISIELEKINKHIRRFD
jgi:hypothetical protein